MKNRGGHQYQEHRSDLKKVYIVVYNGTVKLQPPYFYVSGELNQAEIRRCKNSAWYRLSIWLVRKVRTKYTCRRLTSVRKQPISNGTPLIPVSSWYTPYFLLLPSFLDSNRLSPYMILTSIPPVSSWGGLGKSHPRLDSYDRFPSLQCQPPQPSTRYPLDAKIFHKFNSQSI